MISLKGIEDGSVGEASILACKAYTEALQYILDNGGMIGGLKEEKSRIVLNSLLHAIGNDPKDWRAFAVAIHSLGRSLVMVHTLITVVNATTKIRGSLDAAIQDVIDESAAQDRKQGRNN